jgi:hypothetical protein
MAVPRKIRVSLLPVLLPQVLPGDEERMPSSLRRKAGLLGKFLSFSTVHFRPYNSNNNYYKESIQSVFYQAMEVSSLPESST